MASAVKGMDQLSRNLASLGQNLGHKTLRQAAMQTTTPVFKEIKAAAPVGKVAHKTYKGRVVAPGFLKRSIVRRSRAKNGRALVTIGVKPEAFYGVQFLDWGTKYISARHWFQLRFFKAENSMLGSFAGILIDKIKKAIR